MVDSCKWCDNKMRDKIIKQYFDGLIAAVLNYASLNKLFFIFSFIPVLTNAQIAYAGINYPYYFDIVPDTLLNYHYAGPSHLDDESYYIDINNDSQNDLRINARAVSSPGGGNGYTSVLSLNTKTFKRFGRFDATVNKKIALPLLTGDSINSLNSIWDSTALMLTYDNVSMSVYTGISDWYSTNDLFIGIKYEDNIDTLIGWIRVNCKKTSPNVECLVKDYSFLKNSTGIGIKEISEMNIKVFPNPVSTYLNISKDLGFENSEIEVINYLGQTVLKAPFQKQFDVSKLANGCYFAKITTSAKEPLFTKFVKE